MDEEWSRTVRGLSASIGDHWKHEKPLLIPLSLTHYDPASIRLAKVKPRSCAALAARTCHITETNPPLQEYQHTRENTHPDSPHTTVAAPAPPAYSSTDSR